MDFARGRLSHLAGAPTPDHHDGDDLATTEAQLRFVGLRPGMRALDVGCGTGATTRLMARLAARGEATGIDRSEAHLARARLLAAVAGDRSTYRRGLATRLPVAAATQDLCWSRFVFQHLGRPQAALREMVRVTRPGGTVAVADLDGQLTGFHPLPPSLDGELRRALALLRGTGFDPQAGRKLHRRLVAAGLEAVRVRVVPYQVYGSGVRDRDRAAWRLRLLSLAAALAARTGDAARWARFADDFCRHVERADVVHGCSLVVAAGRVPTTAADRDLARREPAWRRMRRPVHAAATPRPRGLAVVRGGASCVGRTRFDTHTSEDACSAR